MSTIPISTAHHLVLEFEAAPLTSRIIATVIDYGLILLSVVVLIVSIGASDTLVESDVMTLVYLALGVTLLFSSFLQEVSFDGQTIGKRIMKIRVLKLDGSAPTVGDYFVRWLTGLLEITASWGSVALASYVVTTKHQRIGDVVAGTAVIKLPSAVTVSSLRVDAKHGHRMEYDNVHLLSDADVQIVREVIHAQRTGVNKHAMDAITTRTADAVAAKLRVVRNDDALAFLLRVMADFSHLHKS